MSDERAELFRRVARRYRGSGRFARSYVASKLKHDPVNATLLTRAAKQPFGTVLDLGCGRGQLGIALLEMGAAHAVHAMDRNPSLLRQARQAASGLAFHTEQRDLTNPGALPEVETVLLIDLLYQLDQSAQNRLMAAVARSARQRILIRTADPYRGLRSVITYTLEVFARPIWPHSGECVNAPPPAMITRLLQASGFSVRQEPCWEGTPFANVLLQAERPS